MNLRVAIDGYDGSGKSTLINLLMRDYADKYVTYVEHLLPITVSLFKRYSGNTNDYMNTINQEFRVSSYLWESYIRMQLCDLQYQKNDIVFFDRWIYTNLTGKINFGENSDFINFLIASIPRPDILFLIKTSSHNIIKHLKQKDDWMLRSYTEIQIMEECEKFYEGYEKILESSNITYMIIDGNNPLSDMKNVVKDAINELLLEKE